jgi:hypothetical protein
MFIRVTFWHTLPLYIFLIKYITLNPFVSRTALLHWSWFSILWTTFSGLRQGKKALSPGDWNWVHDSNGTWHPTCFISVTAFLSRIKFRRLFTTNLVYYFIQYPVVHRVHTFGKVKATRNENTFRILPSVNLEFPKNRFRVARQLYIHWRYVLWAAKLMGSHVAAQHTTYAEDKIDS